MPRKWCGRPSAVAEDLNIPDVREGEGLIGPVAVMRGATMKTTVVHDLLEAS